MREEKGMTLLELVVAMTVVGVIFLAGTSLLLYSGKAVKRIYDETVAQQELVRLFHIVDQDMENIIVDPNAKAVRIYTGAPLCYGSTLQIPGTVSARIAKQQGSPCVECYVSTSGAATNNVCELQFNRNVGTVQAPIFETVIYYYKQKNLANNLYTVLFQKKVIKSNSVSVAETNVTARLFAYADADLNMNGEVTGEERTARDTCLDQTDASGRKTSLLASASCWGRNVDTELAVFPAFNVSKDRKALQISARTRFGQVGVTKTIRSEPLEG